jgi:hypothetical protein
VSLAKGVNERIDRDQGMTDAEPGGARGGGGASDRKRRLLRIGLCQHQRRRRSDERNEVPESLHVGS